MAQAAEIMEDTVIHQLHCQVAPEKGGILASDARTLSLLKQNMQEAGLPGIVAGVCVCANLGVDYTVGKALRKTQRPSLVGRLAKFTKRHRKLMAMGRAAGHKAHRLSLTGGRPSITYGASIAGYSDNELLKQRRLLSKLMKPSARGRSLEALHLLKGDPMEFLAHAPILAWCTECWAASCAANSLQSNAVTLPFLNTFLDSHRFIKTS